MEFFFGTSHITGVNLGLRNKPEFLVSNLAICYSLTPSSDSVPSLRASLEGATRGTRRLVRDQPQRQFLICSTPHQAYAKSRARLLSKQIHPSRSSQSSEERI